MLDLAFPADPFVRWGPTLAGRKARDYPERHLRTDHHLGQNVNSEGDAVRASLQRGLVIPALPLALTASRTLDERRQRALPDRSERARKVDLSGPAHLCPR